MALTNDSFRLQCRRNTSSLASSSFTCMPVPSLSAERISCFSCAVKTVANVFSMSSADGMRPSLPRRRACPGAATSMPHIALGSDASTTKSPSCDTLKLKLGACGSSGSLADFPMPFASSSNAWETEEGSVKLELGWKLAQAARKGLRPLVRSMRRSACGMLVTRAHAARCNRRLASARFLSGMKTILRQSARSFGGSRVSKN
mmetsp:Transcript_3267/g.8089  ORF Transcript_3267/g.8089 Transcript_3267/m.8089 type:complete len:203 (+) Transcript_3267:46-654(+)